VIFDRGLLAPGGDWQEPVSGGLAACTRLHEDFRFNTHPDCA
jgi:hypothetical protein